MKNNIKNLFFIVALLISTVSISFSQSQNTVGYKTLIGRYKTNSANSIICPCNTQGLFRYYYNDKEQLLTLCFDKVKTDYYQIYNDEVITIGGNYVTKTCSNGQNYLVFEVEEYSFEDNTLQRQLIKPVMINKQPSTAVKPLPKTETTKQVTSFTGIYSSKRGVMSPISCYGFNIGYLTLPIKESSDVIICFDKLPGGDNLNINCGNKVYVEGYYENKTISGGGGPCPAGTKKIFYVTKWSCK